MKRQKGLKGEHNGQSKLKDSEIQAIYLSDESIEVLATHYKTHPSYVYGIKARTRRPDATRHL